ncbi:hypothetical protein AYO22_06316 [Fonsecaea multimorphosa]|nr:hypothetical protein AYO22_06316 [Fonsecaea multimorphosa]
MQTGAVPASQDYRCEAPTAALQMLQLSEQTVELESSTFVVTRVLLLIDWKFRFQFFGLLYHPAVLTNISKCGELGRMFSRSQSFSSKGFRFSCTSSSHYPTPHYMGLPTFLPHQDHPCPPCQLEEFRMNADREAIASARAQYPHLTCEMLVRDGRKWEEWQTKPSLEKFVEEKRTDEKQMWLHVTRKWTQDLKKVRVLVSEEDGLGLLG